MAKMSSTLCFRTIICNYQQTSISLSPDGLLIASWCLEGPLLLHRVTDGKHLACMEANEEISCLEWVDQRCYEVVCGFKNGDIGIIQFNPSKVRMHLKTYQISILN